MEQEITVSSDQFEFIKLLGKGTYGKVFAVKSLVSSILEGDEEGKDPRRILVNEE